MAADNKTEHPTSRRLQKAREKGQVARSREVPSAVVLVGGLLVVFYTSEQMATGLMDQMKIVFRLRVPSDLSVIWVNDLIRTISLGAGIIVAPVALICLALGIASNVVQGGLVFSTEGLGFHFEKLNPASGFGRLFSKNGLVQLVKGVLLISIVSFVGYKVVCSYLPIYPRLVLMDTRQLIYWTGSISFELFIKVGAFLFIIALGDYAFQKHQYLDQLKMTKQEVKDEFREMEGDPMIKGRIRRLQREASKKRMMADVPTADVVITNPTHYAVALSYKMDSMEAPKVVAKGVGFLALKIKELAREHDVPMVENRPLAQTLYKSVEVGQTIPAELYRAVAEILAYIYKLRNAWRR
jgi:flagellar biosynthesis protein FlhB